MVLFISKNLPTLCANAKDQRKSRFLFLLFLDTVHYQERAQLNH